MRYSRSISQAKLLKAMAWDESFSLRADPSGRAAGVHDSAYDEAFEADDKVGGEPATKKAKA